MHKLKFPTLATALLQEGVKKMRFWKGLGTALNAVQKWHAGFFTPYGKHLLNSLDLFLRRCAEDRITDVQLKMPADGGHVRVDYF